MSQDKYKEGTVTNCLLLNLRKQPDENSEVCVVLPEDTKVIIDPAFENDLYYRVIVKSLIHKINCNFNRDYHGYCMKRFIKV